jgi:hypothetical protein
MLQVGNCEGLTASCAALLQTCVPAGQFLSHPASKADGMQMQQQQLGIDMSCIIVITCHDNVLLSKQLGVAIHCINGSSACRALL